MRFQTLTPVLAGLASLGLALGGTMLGAPAAQAQTQRQTAPGPTSGTTATGNITNEQSPGLPPVDASQNTRGTGNREIFQVLGLSAEITAPVTPAYNADAAYRTFAGQPMRGEGAILAQSIDGAP